MILRKFMFLAPSFNLKRKSSVYGYEYVDRYSNEEVLVTVFVAHPELPHVTIDAKPERSYYYCGNTSLKNHYYGLVSPRSYASTADTYGRFVDSQARSLDEAVHRISKSHARARPGRDWKRKR